jgi:hypothetical protein
MQKFLYGHVPADQLLYLVQDHMSLLNSRYRLHNKIGIGISPHQNEYRIESKNLFFRLNLQERGQLRGMTRLTAGLYSSRVERVWFINIVVQD